VQNIDVNGNYPLHVACRIFRNNIIANNLLDVYPIAASHSNGDRDYPLHICCHETNAYKIIDKLIQIDPCVASKPDKNNEYPFYLICQNNDWSYGCNVVLKQLITCFPEATG
jgi:Ankyrin repeat